MAKIPYGIILVSFLISVLECLKNKFKKKKDLFSLTVSEASFHRPVHLGKTSWQWEHVAKEVLQLIASGKQSKVRKGMGQDKIQPSRTCHSPQ
jgi:cytochrome c biogenesis protein ResB